ncbi:unnamed protein product [Blepharisma stoltei]|uniref:Uncharacterized protein n=1 Tax=Blepharisma stoltei TaxID=1481888 RepID=A0AAU9IP62_9CILI|nr:unnamed protein product [Blepharisma stoltei]
MSGIHSKSVMLTQNQSINTSKLSSQHRDLSQPRAYRCDHNILENSIQSVKSFDSKQPVSTSRRSCTPNFGIEQSERYTSRQALNHQFEPLSSSRQATRNMSGLLGYPESNEELQTFGNSKKPRIPKLPLDSLLEEDSEQASLNLSAIGCEISSKNQQPVTIAGEDESFQLIKMLEQEAEKEWENNTLQLSPVANQKTYSRLDESSIIGPQCKVLIDKPLQCSTENKENNIPRNINSEVKALLRKQAQKYDKALIILQTQFISYKENAEKQIFMLQQEMASLKTQVNPMENFKEKLIDVFKTQLNTVKNAYAEKFENCMKDVEAKLVEGEQHKKYSQKKMEELRKEYDLKLQINEQSIFTLKKQNEDLKDQLGKIGGGEKDYEELLNENKKLREELTGLWKDYGRRRLKYQV